MCMSVLPKCVCMHCMHMPNPQRLEEGCDSLELELQIVMGCHVGTLNHWTIFLDHSGLKKKNGFLGLNSGPHVYKPSSVLTNYVHSECVLPAVKGMCFSSKNTKQWFSSCAHSKGVTGRKKIIIFWIVFKFVDTSTISTIVGFCQIHIGIGVSELNKTHIQTTEEEKVSKPLLRIFWDVRSLNKVLDRGRQSEWWWQRGGALVWRSSLLSRQVEGIPVMRT